VCKPNFHGVGLALSWIGGRPFVGLVVNRLLVAPFPFWLFLEPWPLLILVFCD